MMELKSAYNRDAFLHFLEENFLPDFKKDIRPASTQGLATMQKAYSLGRSESLDLQVFEFSFEGSPNKRVTLTKDAFQVMRSYAVFRALAIFHSPDSDDWRLSLMTATPERTEKGKVALTYSNPKRLSFFLGPNAKVNTPTRFILKRERIIDFDDLKSRFSIEVVNKEFYKEISKLFTQLVGGSVQNGTKREIYQSLLKLPSIPDKSQTSLEFAVRLIGRVIFCWFLREKKSDQGKPLMPTALLSLEAIMQNHDYYHSILEPIFFEVLNKPVKSRKDDYASGPYSSIPYLNGGLFSPHDDDFFSYNDGKQAINHNMVVVPNEWIHRFFDVLETYNFTIDENTSFDEELSIDPEMLGRIFENLLAEINPETGESARRSTGSYYTPRAIVDYMVDESLLLYLQTQTQIDEGKLRAAISYDLNDDKVNQLTEHERERIISALEKIKILDPACGSGAFPIGALQKIVFILQQADPEGHLWFKKQIRNTPPEVRRVIEREFAYKNFDYIRKLGIIRENIYGVDIQPIATEISRLRCFLTLVVDERIQEDLENRGIEPLPNLDFKFVTANSLISLPGSQKNSQIGLFEDDEGIRELKELRDMFFNASGSEREQLRLQFVQAQNRMFQRLISENRRGHAELTTKLTTWDPFSHNTSSWFDPEWMFGISSGFSIVIGNPPYVQLQKSEGILADLYSNQGYETFARTGDIYTLFYERGVLAADADTGIICFITSNKWMRAGYGKQLRKFLLNKTQPVCLIDFGSFSVFETATVDTCIFLGRRGQYGEAFIAAHCTTDDFSSTEGLGDYVRSKQIHVMPEELDASGEMSWSISSSEELHLKQKIEMNGRPLKDWKVKMRRGIVTGYNEAFIIDENTKRQLIERDPRSAEIIKPVLRGRDIKKYAYEFANEYIIATFPAKHVDIDSYEKIKKYLETFGHKLEQTGTEYIDKNGIKQKTRKKTGNRWFETQDQIDYYKVFENEKIVWGNLALKPQFALVEPGMYINAPSTFIASGSRYLLAILNSKVSNFYIKTQGVSRSGGYIEFKPMFIERMPIPIPDDRNIALINNIEQLCQEIIDARRKEPLVDISNMESKIDQLVYKLYGLTKEEIKIVEGQNGADVATRPALESTLHTELTRQLSTS